METTLTKSRLYDFFITDDPARRRAFLTGCIVGVGGGLILIEVGASRTVAALVTIAINVVVFSWLAIKYSMRVHAEPASSVAGRRSILQLILASISAWEVDSVLGKAVPMALAYAVTVRAEIRSGHVPSSFKTAIAKQVLFSAIADPTRKNPRELRNAAAVLSAAEVYSVAYHNSIPHQASNETLSGSPQVGYGGNFLVGRGRGIGGTAVHSTVPGCLFQVKNNFGLQDLAVESDVPAPKIQPQLLCVSGSPKISVVRCAFKNVSVILDFAAWIDVEFVNCYITTFSGQVVLVDCLFTNCRFNASITDSQELSQITSGGKITIVSEGLLN